MAEMSMFLFNTPMFAAFVENPVGPIGRALEEEGQRIAVAAKEYVGIQWPGGKSDPPQPFRRSGQLQESIRALEPLVIGGVLQVQVVADPVNERDGFPYAPWLREHGYQFVDPDALGL